MKKTAVLLLLLLIGCQSLEKTARDSIAAFDGYLSAAKTRHDTECKADTENKLPVCLVIVRGIRAENATVTALETYCQLKPGQGSDPTLSCTPVQSAEAGLRSALSNLDQLLSEIKGAAK